MARLLTGGPRQKSASERFKFRLDILIELNDVELALEEAHATVWYMAVCAQCSDTPKPFERDAERSDWAGDHVDSTGHYVIKFEEPRRQE